MTSLIRLAGVCIQVDARYPSFAYASDAYAVSTDSPEMHVSVTDADIDAEWRRVARGDACPGALERHSVEPVLETSAIWRRIADRLPRHNALLMHGAVVTDGDIGCMFAAPSGAGKTTRAKLLVDAHPGLTILNGDKPVVRVEDDGLVACDSPWRGKEGYGEAGECRLTAIFLLERAAQTRFTEIPVGHAFEHLLAQTHVPPDSEDTLMTLRLLHSFDGKVRVYRYESEPSARSALEAWIHTADS